MLEGIPIHIGGRTRHLKLTSEAMLVAQSLLPGNMTIAQALSQYRDTGTVAIVAAAALRHESKGKERISPLHVCRWLDHEQGKYPELERAVLAAAERHYVAVGLLKPGELSGEEGEDAPAGTPSSPAGSTSAASPAASASTPDSSDG